ncbi:MAG: hypothetical protein KDC61_17900 [Saprospiraceae bacterium]|nr:hypothetical protein [Saprospiraceae bacterium]
MEKQFLMNDDVLWDYADQLLPETERLRVEAYLEQHPEWKERLAAIESEKRMLSSMPLEKPRAGFADRVMAAWAAEQSHGRAISTDRGKDWIVWAVSGIFGLFVCAAVLMIIVQGVPQDAVNLPEMPVVDWGGMLRQPAMRIGLYLVLTLLVLKLVEKYLQQRRMLDRLNMHH